MLKFMDETGKLKFRISSALKDLIGKDLITDQYVAIFELVKNAYDAYATKVRLTFENINSGNAKIIIKDDGKGMDYFDLKNKWLFVAYSAKKDGTEDIENTDLHDSSSEYRNKIKQKRMYAGAKGVGRFSCDRLGSELNLITIKDSDDARIENIFVNWEDFEKDSKEEFINVDVEHRNLNIHPNGFQNGTILEISNLRDKWDRTSLLKLKKTLQKLINPNRENDINDFIIEMIVEEEMQNDVEARDKAISKEKGEALKKGRTFYLDDIKGELELIIVNGEIKNTIFETLGIKSTHIRSEISIDGNFIETSLWDRGQLIYKIKETNDIDIKNTKIHLFYLNTTAKSNFTRLMGIDSVNYGSVFMYKNGFRIYPYGEKGEDFFGINKRKTQGQKRYFGTREITGRFEITGNDDSIKESTSRDGGLIKNVSYYSLQKFFIKTLRMLERYVIETVDWGKESLFEDEESKQMDPKTAIQKIEDVIKKLSNSKQLIEITYDENFLANLNERLKKSASAKIKEIKDYAKSKEDIQLVEKINKIENEYKNVLVANEQLGTEVEASKYILDSLQKDIKQKSDQILFLKSVSTLDIDNILNLHHQIGIYANDIDGQLRYWNRKLNRGDILNTEDIRSMLEGMTLLNKKVLSVSKFATKANFTIEAEQIEADIVSFIAQYTDNIYNVFANSPINIVFKNDEDLQFVLKFKPIEFTIIIDNLINNSRKANARNIEISISKHENMLRLVFSDDGNGLPKSIKNVEEIFEKGFTTTSGSGLGLYHVRQLVEEMNGTIIVNTEAKKGLEFVMEVQT